MDYSHINRLVKKRKGNRSDPHLDEIKRREFTAENIVSSIYHHYLHCEDISFEAYSGKWIDYFGLLNVEDINEEGYLSERSKDILYAFKTSSFLDGFSKIRVVGSDYLFTVCTYKPLSLSVTFKFNREGINLNSLYCDWPGDWLLNPKEKEAPGDPDGVVSYDRMLGPGELSVEIHLDPVTFFETLKTAVNHLKEKAHFIEKHPLGNILRNTNQVPRILLVLEKLKIVDENLSLTSQKKELNYVIHWLNENNFFNETTYVSKLEAWKNSINGYKMKHAKGIGYKPKFNQELSDALKIFLGKKRR